MFRHAPTLSSPPGSAPGAAASRRSDGTRASVVVFVDDGPAGPRLAATLARSTSFDPAAIRIVDVWAEPGTAVAQRVVTIPTAVLLVDGIERGRITDRGRRGIRRLAGRLPVETTGGVTDPHRIPRRSPRPPRRRSVR